MAYFYARVQCVLLFLVLAENSGSRGKYLHVYNLDGH